MPRRESGIPPSGAGKEGTVNLQSERNRSVSAGMSVAVSAIGGQAPLLVSVGDAARMLGIGETVTWRMVSTGEIASVHLGRRRLVLVKSLEEFVERLQEEGVGNG